MGDPLIERVRRAFEIGSYRLTDHAETEREDDTITVQELEHALTSPNLELLEDYPDDPRGASALVLGFTKTGDPVHVVLGLASPEVVVVVTVYRPDALLWYDWRERVA